MVLPQFNYGSGTLNWTDSSGTAHSQPVVAGTAVSVTPSQTTTYTLSVTYQDPTTVRTSLITGTAALTVNVVTPPSLVASLNLSTAPAGTVTLGTQIQVTPTFSVPAELTLNSSSILINDDTTAPIAATSGTPVVHSPTVNTIYKLKVCYTDTRVVPSVSSCESRSATVIQVVSGPTKLSTGGLLNIARSDFTATSLQNGMVMIAGGINSAGAVEKSVELYDPVNNKWVRTGDMKTARRGHAATLLRDGRVLITGGYDGTTATSALNKAETYDPATGVWTNTTGTLVQARRWHTSTLLNNDKVLIAGGGVSSGVSRVVELFDPVAGTFTATGSLQLPRQGHTATLLPNGTQVLIVGRNNADNTFSGGVDSSRTTELYDISAGTWSAGPVMTYGRDSHTATLVGNSNVLLVSGGYNAGTNRVESLDLATTPLAWTTSSPMSVSRALHTSTYIPSTDKVLVIGGYNATSQMLTSTELFTLTASTPPSGTWSTTGNKELTLARAMHTSTLLSNGNVLVLGTYYTTSGTVSNTTEIWSP
jgi:N-acetylneuraminic acid mutarotase